VHVWSYDRLLDALPSAEWLVKHNPPELHGSVFRQAWWQRRSLPREARAEGVDILLNTDAGTVCRTHPAVVISRDMLSYEPGEMHRYRFRGWWLRLLALRYIQASSLRESDGAIFLTRYAAEAIQRFSGPLSRVAIIPHGIGPEFRRAPRAAKPASASLRCVYVSPIDLYKHQWFVVRAIAELRLRGHDVTLVLTGGGDPRAKRLLAEEMARSDPRGEFVTQRGFVRPDDLPALLAEADVFVFASSCENMPNTLVEAMANGLPIASSNRGPMPEVLQNAGVYFDPEDARSIADAIEPLLADPALRDSLAHRGFELARQYSWERCAAETWAFLRATFDATRPQRRMASEATLPIPA
jgi:glycosyltransferase involved in cell wall biosynthesis